jgi:phospholipid/cholesterol/gamma-HCH transport system ATP-binding protein
MNEALVNVAHLEASFGDHKVLEDVSFTVEKGGITVLLGASGSGKTTVLKHLLGLYDNQPDKISVLGQDMGQLDEDLKKELYLKMGVFYQNGALISSMTVGENIALPLQQHTKISEKIIERMVRLKLHMVNLDDSFDLYPSELSGGMLKRAALARAIIMDPPLVFCDEPGAGLDPVTLASLDELILSLNHQLGITFLIVTHELASIQRIADKIVFLADGKVAFEGDFNAAKKAEHQGVRDFFNTH